MKFLADENFNGHIARALTTRIPPGSFVRVQDVSLSGIEDRIVLEWAAAHDCILLTHDVRTMTAFAYERVVASLPMPGVFQVSNRAAIQVVVADLVLIFESDEPADWTDRVTQIPLK